MISILADSALGRGLFFVVLRKRRQPEEPLGIISNSIARVAEYKTPAMHLKMKCERSTVAIARIERALERMEMARSVSASPGDENVRALAELKLRHHALKQEMSRALSDLDGLIVNTRAKGS